MSTNHEHDALDTKLNAVFAGRVVRKDLLQQIKKGTNVPSFVLEFLLSKYCASDDPEEIKAGIAAVFETLDSNYVRPDESNKAQSTVEQKGHHKFIDKVHVKYVEKEKRHWAAMENFNSRRIAINPEFYRDNDRLLEGGIWAEVTLRYNPVEEDDYAFYVQDLRPIQLSRFDVDRFLEGRLEFTRDEWLDAILRSVGLEPSKVSKRVKFHIIARLFPLVEANFNFIELGPRGTGKSYFYSEFSPYATLVSGGQASKATLFYNNARNKVGLVGFWDTVAFDEVAGIKIKDDDAIQIMKDFMANGRFSRGTEVIANASLAFVGNIDHSVRELVRSREHDLFVSLPKALDLAIMDRFYLYLPGWEMPKTSSEYLTDRFGFITDYLAEAFHHMFKHMTRYDYVNARVKLGSSVEGRDEKAIKKTLCGFLKILHPAGEPTDAEFEEYVAYAIESRRRVKEQMNKRKADDEFANINLSFFNSAGEEIVVHCPESKNVPATQRPREEVEEDELVKETTTPAPAPVLGMSDLVGRDRSTTSAPPELEEKHLTIRYDDTGHSYRSIFGSYAKGAKSVKIEDSYIRANHQIGNLVRFCELMVETETVRKISLRTKKFGDAEDLEVEEKLAELRESLKDFDIELDVKFSPHVHDREIRFDNGWVVKIGRGLDLYQPPNSWFEIGASDLDRRRCLETKVDIYRDL